MMKCIGNTSLICQFKRDCCSAFKMYFSLMNDIFIKLEFIEKFAYTWMGIQT
uniref:Uncharacterized protein n=1 Tax=Ascaris lumbricoides TaxID=6252 RepID=A0A0M3IMC3_ASCLU